MLRHLQSEFNVEINCSSGGKDKFVKPDMRVRPEYTKRVVRFLDDGFHDYIAARVLLLSGLLQQGAVLASTAVEKYLKAILATRGNEAHGHLKKAHWFGVKNQYPELFKYLNVGFLELCQKSYALRYTEDLPPNYNVVVANREFLAELDVTVLSIEPNLLRSQADGVKRKTRFELFTESRDHRLLQDNHCLFGQPKEQFIYSGIQAVYELRKVASGDIMEVQYTTNSRPQDTSFTRAGLAPKSNDGRSYEFSHLPIKSAD